MNKEERTVPTLVTARADTVEPEPLSWLWPERIPLGKLTLIAGDPGLGKSLVTTSLAAHISSGRPWPVDGAPCPQGRVLMVTAEDDLSDTIRPRLDAAGADPSLVEIVGDVKHGDGSADAVRSFSLDGDVGLLADLLKSRGDVRLIVIDPVTAYLGRADAHRNADVRALLAPLGRIASEHKAAIVAVSHLNKNEWGNALYRMSGSLAFVAAARAAFIVAADPGDPKRRVFLPAKHNLAPLRGGLAFTIEEGDNGAPAVEWSPHVVEISADEVLRFEPEENRGERHRAEEWLRDVLSEGPVSAGDVRRGASAAGLAWRTIERAKPRLSIEVEKRGFGGDSQWFWCLPAKAATSPCTGKVAVFDDSGGLRNLEETPRPRDEEVN